MTTIARDRAGALAAAGAIHVGLIYLLLTGLGINVSTKIDEAMQLIEVGPPPPPPIVKTIPSPKPVRRPEGGAAPPNLRSVATPIVVPPPVVRLPVPSPVVTAPVAGSGTQATTGNAEVAGPGTGSGGFGDGSGSGTWGSGDGGGDEETPPRLVKGRLKDSDYPHELSDAGIGGRVSVRYVVDERGRVGRCDITRSSGSAELDDTTCRLIQERFRFEPSRDARGYPVESVIVESHEWLSRRGDGDRR